MPEIHTYEDPYPTPEPIPYEPENPDLPDPEDAPPPPDLVHLSTPEEAWAYAAEHPAGTPPDEAPPTQPADAEPDVPAAPVDIPVELT